MGHETSNGAKNIVSTPPEFSAFNPKRAVVEFDYSDLAKGSMRPRIIFLADEKAAKKREANRDRVEMQRKKPIVKD